VPDREVEKPGSGGCVLPNKRIEGVNGPESRSRVSTDRNPGRHTHRGAKSAGSLLQRGLTQRSTMALWPCGANTQNVSQLPGPILCGYTFG
jgi:hypothetical protein